MSSDKLTSTYIPHLAGQFRQATPVLFTGAGFSVGAKSIAGIAIPSYDELRHQIWKISFPGEEYEEGSSLQDLFEDARLRHNARLKGVLKKLFTVETQDLPDFYRTIYSMPWSRCYTLNVDNLEVAASSAFELPTKMKPLSGTNRRTVERTQESYHFLEVFHLNGCLDDLTDHVTFSVLQYAERQATPDPSYLQLITDLMMRPFVFIGSSLDEPPLWQHLELRRNKGGRGQRELRPRSYLVTPSLPRARQALLGVFNTVWLQMTAEEFAGQVLSKLQTLLIRLTHTPTRDRFCVYNG